MAATRSSSARSLADGVGIAGSVACALHCIATPVLLVAGTALPASILTDERFHEWMLWLVLPASMVAFTIGCWQHKDRMVLALGVLGLAGLVSSVALSSVALAHAWLGETGERIVTVASAGLLVAAHVRNFTKCRSDDCDHAGGAA